MQYLCYTKSYLNGEGIHMLPDKIKITKEICSIIKNKREEIGISARDLSMKHLGKSQGFISSLENCRVKYLKRKDILKLFEVLYTTDENTAMQKIQSIINSQNEINPDKLSETISLKNTSKALNETNVDGTYDTIEDPTEEITLEKLVDNIKLGFETIYKKKPDFTISTLKRFVVSLHFDFAFMMVILRTPYFALEGLDHDERQKFLNELSDIFKKYALLSKAHMDEQKKDETPEAENNSSSADAVESQDFNTDSDDSDQSK
jgi:hypothetical protein